MKYSQCRRGPLMLTGSVFRSQTAKNDLVIGVTALTPELVKENPQESGIEKGDNTVIKKKLTMTNRIVYLAIEKENHSRSFFFLILIFAKHLEFFLKHCEKKKFSYQFLVFGDLYNC